jgi:hypothetical protein
VHGDTEAGRPAWPFYGKCDVFTASWEKFLELHLFSERPAGSQRGQRLCPAASLSPLPVRPPAPGQNCFQATQTLFEDTPSSMAVPLPCKVPQCGWHFFNVTFAPPRRCNPKLLRCGVNRSVLRFVHGRLSLPSQDDFQVLP